MHAHVYGEHGDTSFVPWSLVHIANNHVDAYRESSPDKEHIQWDSDYQGVEDYVRKSGAIIIENKGATFYAVAMSVCHICKCVLNSASTALTVSTMFHGEYGLEDVCLSVLTLVNNTGARGVIKNELTEEEMKKLHASADKLKSVIAQLEI